MRKTSYTYSDLRRLKTLTTTYLVSFKKAFAGYSKSNFQMVKFHHPTHVAHFIMLFGPPTVWSAQTWEMAHKFYVKLAFLRTDQQLRDHSEVMLDFARVLQLMELLHAPDCVPEVVSGLPGFSWTSETVSCTLPATGSAVSTNNADCVLQHMHASKCAAPQIDITRVSSCCTRTHMHVLQATN